MSKKFSLLILLVYSVLATGMTLHISMWSMNKSSIKIAGTSSLHDWEMKVERVQSVQQIEINANELIIHSVELKSPVKSITSDNSMMDSKTFDALKGKQFPFVKFIATQSKLALEKGVFNGKIMGVLEIAGKTRQVEVPISGVMKSNNILELKGDYRIDMIQYGVEPPTAMFGTIKTGKDVLVSYSFELTTSL
jgi:polyisoprenoid-binding protein YceI